eukprot:scaffold609207_cov17-Prasinocladus_malaysianus.AAC.1
MMMDYCRTYYALGVHRNNCQTPLRPFAHSTTSGLYIFQAALRKPASQNQANAELCLVMGLCKDVMA